VKRLPLYLLVADLAVLAWSATGPSDLFTWFCEVVPALIAFAVMAATYRRFRLTNFLYCFIAMHAVILMIGGRYTYAEVPIGNWARDTFHLARNHYDRIGHFAQGFVPALVTRELLLRRSPLERGKWLVFLTTCVCLAISAFYEFIEWWVAVATGEAAQAFLGTQGDVWDTQWDMFMAFLGAITAQVLLSRVHDRAIASMSGRSAPPLGIR
jgi:putative membrane protein